MDKRTDRDLRDYFKRYLTEIIYCQGKSEGISITFFETEDIINNRNTDKYPDFDRDVIISLKRGWQYIMDNLHKDFVLEDIILLNTIINDGTNSELGRLRRHNVKIRCFDDSIYYPETISEFNVREKIYYLNKIEDPLTRAMETFAYFTKAQCFNNCNKRTASFLTNKILMESCNFMFYVEDRYNAEFLNTLTEYYQNEEAKIKIINLIQLKHLHSFELDDYRFTTESYTLEDIKSRLL